MRVVPPFARRSVANADTAIAWQAFNADYCNNIMQAGARLRLPK